MGQGGLRPPRNAPPVVNESRAWAYHAVMLPLLVALASASPAARLDALVSAAALDADGLAALARTDPATAWQLLDPASRAALDYVLALPAAEIRQVREGQTVIRSGGEGSDDEWAALWQLAEALGEKPRKVLQVRVRTVDAQVVRVDLELRRETHGVDIAWPAESAPPKVSVDLWRSIGVDVDPPAPLQDGGFEVPWSAGLAWDEEAPAGTLIARDTARVKVGAASLRLESHTRALPRVTQTLAARSGERLVLTGQVAADGAEPVVALVFRDASGHEEREVADVRAGASGWGTFVLDVTAPLDLADARLELSLSGPGAANFDDLAFRGSDRTVSPLATWWDIPAGSLVVHADPARCDDGRGAKVPSCGAEAASRVNMALKAGLGRLSVQEQGTVDVWVLADDAHRASLATRAPGGPRGLVDDYAAGTCWTMARSDWSAVCPVRVMLERAWGPPGNDVLGAGLPRALAGSGTDLHAAARASLGSVPGLDEIARSRVGGPSREAAITSFAAWLLDTQSLAAVRAAWQAEDLDAYTIAGQDLAALEAAWRATVVSGAPAGG